MRFGKYETRDRPHPAGSSGIQCLIFFPNGYGASIVKFYGSYGFEKGLWEMAVLKGSYEKDWTLTYDTSITNDVLGYLSEEEVEKYLDEVQRLSPL